jgi:hypothetical protein
MTYSHGKSKAAPRSERAAFLYTSRSLSGGGVVEKAGVIDRLITPSIEKAKSDGALVVSLAPVVLSRTVGDTATPTSALIAWNSCGAYMAATVATWSYSPYASSASVVDGASANGGNQVAWHPAVIEPSDRPSARTIRGMPLTFAYLDLHEG